MAQTDTQTDGHGDSMTNSAQRGRVGENVGSLCTDYQSGWTLAWLGECAMLLVVFGPELWLNQILPSTKKKGSVDKIVSFRVMGTVNVASHWGGRKSIIAHKSLSQTQMDNTNTNQFLISHFSRLLINFCIWTIEDFIDLSVFALELYFCAYLPT